MDWFYRQVNPSWLFIAWKVSLFLQFLFTQSTGAVEYTDCISAEL